MALTLENVHEDLLKPGGEKSVHWQVNVECFVVLVTVAFGDYTTNLPSTGQYIVPLVSGATLTKEPQSPPCVTMFV